MFTRKFYIAIIIILALTLSACAPDNGVNNQVPENPSAGEQVPDKNVVDNNVVEPGEETLITPMAALDIYINKYPNNKIKEIELDNNKGIYTYKIEGYENNSEFEMKIDSVNGDILSEEQDIEEDFNKYGDITKENLETIEAYVKKVLDEAGNGSVLDEWTIKAKDGRILLEIEVDLPNGDDIEHIYDIETGELVERND